MGKWSGVLLIWNSKLKTVHFKVFYFWGFSEIKKKKNFEGHENKEAFETETLLTSLFFINDCHKVIWFYVHIYHKD